MFSVLFFCYAAGQLLECTFDEPQARFTSFPFSRLKKLHNKSKKFIVIQFRKTAKFHVDFKKAPKKAKNNNKNLGKQQQKRLKIKRL